MRQIVLMNQNFDVQPLPTGEIALTSTDQVTGDIYVLPMTDEVAKTIGSRLAAPRVVLPGQGPPLDGNGGLN